MKVINISASRQRIAFDNTYESAMFLGRTNENAFCYEAALNCYQRAARNAPSEDRRNTAQASADRASIEIEEQKGFHRKDADRLFPRGCTCPETDGGGDCDWCQVYYHGAEDQSK